MLVFDSHRARFRSRATSTGVMEVSRRGVERRVGRMDRPRKHGVGKEERGCSRRLETGGVRWSDYRRESKVHRFRAASEALDAPLSPEKSCEFIRSTGDSVERPWTARTGSIVKAMYQTITGRRLKLESLSADERKLLIAIERKFRARPEWTEFASWWVSHFRKAQLPAASVVRRVCQDLEARLGIAQRKMAAPDYRDYLADLHRGTLRLALQVL